MLLEGLAHVDNVCGVDGVDGIDGGPLALDAGLQHAAVDPQGHDGGRELGGVDVGDVQVVLVALVHVVDGRLHDVDLLHIPRDQI